jgi:hypothetical protein
MIHARDIYTGASVRIGITERPEGAAELMMVHNGTAITSICSGAHLQKARTALEALDVDAFGELIFPTQLETHQPSPDGFGSTREAA